LEKITIDDLQGFLEAHEQWKALQTKMTIKENKVMHAQHNLGRGRGYVCIVVVERRMKREDKQTNKTGVDETMIVEEDVIVLVI